MSCQGLHPSPGDHQRVFPWPPSDRILQFYWPGHPLHPLPRGRDLVSGTPQSVLEQDLQSVCICEMYVNVNIFLTVETGKEK